MFCDTIPYNWDPQYSGDNNNRILYYDGLVIKHRFNLYI